MKIKKFIISILIASVILNIQFVQMGYAPSHPQLTGKGDLNNDGKVDIIDLGILLSSWGRIDKPLADLNQDGRVDIIDLGILLSSWGGTTTTTVPTTTTTLPPGSTTGIWISRDEIMRLPTSGSAWDNVKVAADSLSNMNAVGGHGSTHDVHTMAAALVAVRLNDANRKRIVANEIIEAVNNQVENDGNSLSLTRTLPGYIIAADIIDLKNFDSAADAKFRNWLEYVVYQLQLDGATQIEKHQKANNHGTQAAVVRLAADLYLDKKDDFATAVEMFKAWLGEQSSYTGGFNWGDLCWQADPSRPVGINRKGSTMVIAGQSRNVDGVLPDEQRRSGCPSGWPPPKENYVYGGLEGVVGQAVILSRQGYDVWNWKDKAILRAFQWLHNEANYPATGDDIWQPWVVNYYYCTNFPAPSPSQFGKQLGWTDWTHARNSACP